MIQKEDPDYEEEREMLTMQHTFIDFSYLIIGQKLDKFRKNPESDEVYDFDSLELSRLMSLCAENEQLIGQQSIQRIIDNQYKVSRPVYINFFRAYAAFFMFPFILSQIFYDTCEYEQTEIAREKLIKITCMISCLIAQLALFANELNQMYLSGG